MSRIFDAVFTRAALVAAAVMGPLLAPPGAAHAQGAPRVPTVRAPDAPVVISPAPRFHRPVAGPADATAVAGTLNIPYGMTVDNTGKLYVANIFGNVTIYNKGLLVGTITSGVNFPTAVAVAFNGSIYVANNGGNNITIYNPSLNQIGTISDPSLQQPSSMFIDADDDIWVLDASGTTHLYSPNGTPLWRVTTGGTAVGPWGPYVTVWGAADGQGGEIELVQNRSDALRDGATFPIGYPGSPVAGAEAQDAQGQEYVTDITNNVVQVWSRNGAYKTGTIPLPAAGYGVAVDSNAGRLYVSLAATNEVLEFSIKPPFKLLRTIR